MSPTPQLRYRCYYVVLDGSNGKRVQYRALQQLWREHHIPAGETQAREEWRDVPVIEEN